MEVVVALIIFTIALLLDIAISAAFLWVGMKVASVYAGMPNGGQYCEYPDLFKVVAIAAVASVIPYIGTVLSIVVLFYMLRKVTEADVMELIIMVLVSRLAALVAVPFLLAIF